MLMQDGHLTAYFNRALSNRTLEKSVYEKELMALVLAIQHSRPYLLGNKFRILTDQTSSKFLLQQRVTTPN